MHVTRSTGAFGAGRDRRVDSQPPCPTAWVSCPQEWELDADDLEIRDAKLGVGAFGEVFKGKWQGSPVACKRMKVRRSIASAADEEARARWHSCVVPFLR